MSLQKQEANNYTLKLAILTPFSFLMIYLQVVKDPFAYVDSVLMKELISSLRALFRQVTN